MWLMLDSLGSLDAGIAPEFRFNTYASIANPLSVDGYLRLPYIGGRARRVLLAMAMLILQTFLPWSEVPSCASRTALIPLTVQAMVSRGYVINSVS
jgi:hypothetical protein